MRTLPFWGEFGKALDLDDLAARNRAGDSEPLLHTLLKDPHLRALDPDLDFAGALRRARLGTFDAEAFRARGRQAIAAYVQRSAAELSAAFTRDASNLAVILEQKLIPIALALAAADGGPLPYPPLTASNHVNELFPSRACIVSLTHVSSATVIYPGDSAVRRPARYAWRLSTLDDPPSRSVATARVEVGRAVFVDDVDVDPRTGAMVPARAVRRPNHIRTEVLVKGVGVTRYAGNRFSRRTSGVFTLAVGKRDWEHSERLARGGVPVYRPLELALLPYCDWHPHMGWRPMVIYARLPLENLRISDLELLTLQARRRAIGEVATKLRVLTGVPAGRITPAQVLNFLVVRLGRIAGLLESGRTFDGQPFFHGFLHPQNVSLLGEIVDLGEGRFVSGRLELRAAYASSGYVNADRAWQPRIRRARREAIVFHHLTRVLADLMAAVIPGGLPARPELDAQFERGYQAGCAGMRDAQFDACGFRGEAARFSRSWRSGSNA
jgi:hypothetical protein